MIETGVYFDNMHSFHNLNLVLSKVDIPPALPKTNYVEVSGGDGAIDLTEAHGEVRYSDRNCKFTFSMHPMDTMTWEQKQTAISNALNGKRFERITLDKDSDYYFTGRCTVDSWSQDRKNRKIVVSARVKPYKMKQDITVHRYDLTKDEKTVRLWNGRKSVVPTFECSNDNTVVVFNGGTYTLAAGTHKILDICFKEGENVLKLSGSGNIKISYQEGEL